MTDTTPTSSLAAGVASAHFIYGFEHHKAGRMPDAAARYRAAIATDPDHVDALHLLGTILAQAGQPVEAERLIGRALRLKADAPLIWMNHGNVLDLLGRPADAIASYDKALALQPGLVDAVFNRANLLFAQGQFEQALAGYVHAGQLRPGQPPIGTARGNALMALGRHPEALALYEAVLAVAPDYVDALVNRAGALKELARLEDALAAYDAVLRALPGHPAARLGQAHTLLQLGRAHDALASAQRVVDAHPGKAEAWYVRGLAQLGQFQADQALDSFSRAIELKPDFVDAIYNRGEALRVQARFGEAITVLEEVLARQPDHPHAASALATAAMYCCDWAVVERVRPMIEDNVRAGRRGPTPLTLLSLSPSPALQLDCARTFSRFAFPAPAMASPAVARRRDRIKIGYLSADFRRHPVAYLAAGLFAAHDRKRFAVAGFSAGPVDDSPIRRRIAGSFDEFHEVAALPNLEIAGVLRTREIDIAVDLNGHTIYSRIGALAGRPAPVQVTYLGYPGTTGADFIDYVIADPIVAPLADQPFYSERIVHLPDSYQVNDGARAIAAETPTRQALGLPERGFVFCSFNANFKINAPFFSAWMRLLAGVPGSVLWLYTSSEAAVARLRLEAGRHGIDPARLVFATSVDLSAHLARHRLADLTLDTLPYNAHTTGSDSLWAGVPLLTCQGATFAGRVGASLLHAVGLPELVTTSLTEYEALALLLATNPARLAGLRAKLAANRLTARLFDTARFCRHLEQAYETMWEAALRGEPARSFAVAREGVG